MEVTLVNKCPSYKVAAKSELPAGQGGTLDSSPCNGPRSRPRVEDARELSVLGRSPRYPDPAVLLQEGKTSFSKEGIDANAQRSVGQSVLKECRKGNLVVPFA